MFGTTEIQSKRETAVKRKTGEVIYDLVYYAKKLRFYPISNGNLLKFF